MFIPFLGAVVIDEVAAPTTRSPRRASASPARSSAPPAPPSAWRSAKRPTATCCGARLRRLPAEPLQPAAGRPARRRPRDGGDGAVDVVRRLRRAGRARCCCTGNPFLLIFIVLGGMRDSAAAGSCAARRSLEQAAYYRVSPRNRLLVGAVYIGLIVLLVARHGARHVLSSGGHTFGTLASSELPALDGRLSAALRARPRSMSRLVSRSRSVWRLS